MTRPEAESGHVYDGSKAVVSYTVVRIHGSTGMLELCDLMLKLADQEPNGEVVILTKTQFELFKQEYARARGAK